MASGRRDFEQQANVLRLLVGETTESSAANADQVWVLETQVDDVSGEIIAHTTELLMKAGAVDVYTTAIQMKKNRPGILFSVLAHQEKAARLEHILFRETGTLGVRRSAASRHKLTRSAHQVDTTFGPIDGKLARLSDGTHSFAPEFVSCQRVAEQQGVPLRDVYRAAQAAFDLPSAE